MIDKAILVVGPTGTGKSLLSLELALNLNTGIINTDSIQVYKDLVIGSAQPSREDLKIVPHYLYGYLSAGSTLTVADYCKEVVQVLGAKFPNKHALFCGGSGFYIQALEKGMFDVPTLTEAQKLKVDQLISEWGWEASYKKLLEADPRLKIHENDHYRIRRALEIQIINGKNPSELGADKESAPLNKRNVLKIGLDLEKEKLKARITQRTHNMLAQGWIEEVEGLLARGFNSWSALKSVGYAEVVEYLQGHIDKHQMVEKVVISNMQLIKKQKTWFKRDKEIMWFSSENTPEAAKYILSQV